MPNHRATPSLRSAAALVFVTVAVGLGGCAGQVRVDGRFANDAVRAPGYSRILVVGLSPDYNQRCAFEWSMAGSLKNEHTDAMSSCSRLKEGDHLSRESVEKVVADTGADAVLTTVLIDKTYGTKEGGERDTRGTANYKATDAEVGMAYGAGIGYGYGAYGVPVNIIYGQFVTTQPITSLSSKVKVTSTLYETKAGEPVYVMTLDASGLHGRESALATVTPSIAAKLRKDGLIH